MKIRKHKLVIKVKLVGKRYNTLENALIDTGSAFTVIPLEIADFLELVPYRKCPKVNLVTASGLIVAPVKILEKVILEKLTIKNLPVVIHEIPDPAPIKILIGMNLIEKIRLLVDGKAKKFNIYDP